MNLILCAQLQQDEWKKYPKIVALGISQRGIYMFRPGNMVRFSDKNTVSIFYLNQILCYIVAVENGYCPGLRDVLPLL